MFGFISSLMVGEHQELARRRVTGGITYDPAGGGFIAEEAVEHEPWLGRGQAPGAPTAADTTTGVTVAEEMRELAQTRSSTP